MDSVASRYAIALLSVAKENNKVKEYIDEVSEVSSIIKNNKDFQLILKDYGLTSNDKKETLDLAFKGKIDQYILNLLYILCDNKRGSYVLETCDEFVRIGQNELNIKKGIVSSTIKLTKEQLTLMEKKVSELLNCNVILENKIDESLIGGFKVQVEDYILDDSFKNRLNKIKEQLVNKKGAQD